MAKKGNMNAFIYGKKKSGSRHVGSAKKRKVKGIKK